MERNNQTIRNMEEFDRIAQEEYGLTLLSSCLELDRGYVDLFSVTPQQESLLNSYQNYQWESINQRAKMALTSVFNLPVAFIKGSCNYSNGILTLTGGPEYMLLILQQIFPR